MDTSELRERIQEPVPVAERTRFCPPEETLAAYYDAGLEAQARQALQRHLADCDHCQHHLGLLARLDEDHDEELPEVPGDWLAAAKLAGQGKAAPTVRRAPAWGLAAAVLLAVLLAPMLVNRETATTAPSRGDGDTRQLRTLAPAATAPTLLAPTEAARIDAGELVVRWAPVEGALFYDLTVMSDAGDLLVDERVSATEWTAAPGALPPGADYFVRVEASMADTRRVASDYVMFRVEGDD